MFVGTADKQSARQVCNDRCILLLIPGDKCTHVQVGIENEATKSGAGVMNTQPQGFSVFDGPRRSKIGVER